MFVYLFQWIILLPIMLAVAPCYLTCSSMSVQPGTWGSTGHARWSVMHEKKLKTRGSLPTQPHPEVFLWSSNEWLCLTCLVSCNVPSIKQALANIQPNTVQSANRPGNAKNHSVSSPEAYKNNYPEERSLDDDVQPRDVNKSRNVIGKLATPQRLTVLVCFLLSRMNEWLLRATSSDQTW